MMNPTCTGCISRQSETCTCTRMGGGGGGGMAAGRWTCIIPVPIRTCP
jgi:hypothetical protein